LKKIVLFKNTAVNVEMSENGRVFKNNDDSKRDG